MLLLGVISALAASRGPAPPPPLPTCDVGAPPPVLAADARDRALAAPDLATLTPWRARVRADAPVGFETFARGHDSAVEAVVLAAGPTVTVAVDARPFRLVLDVDPAALEPVLARPVPLLPEATAVATTGMRLDLGAGTPVTLLEANGSAVRVRPLSDRLFAAGWVPADAIGTVWTPCPAPESFHDVELVPADPSVPAPAVEVRDAPQGRRLAWVSPRAEWMARSLAPPQKTREGTWQPIVMEDGPMRVSGWVSASRVRKTARVHMYRTQQWTTLVAPPAGRVVVLAPGLALRAPGGERLGSTLDTAFAEIVKEDGAGLHVRVRTEWGPVEAVVSCGTKGPDPSTAAEFMCAL